SDTEEIKKPKQKSATVCGYPISIFFIVVNEFCERFSYYGMRAVLVLYFKYFLKWDDDLATTIYHTFVAFCYLTPILGAIIADSWLGKFKTIVYLSIVYTLGQIVMAISAIHDITDTNKDGIPENMSFHVALSMVGLSLIALGTGGIKPCVAAFGGDQFQDHQEKQRSTFFSIFYLSINAGSLLSTIITPMLRAQECGIYSQQKCYPLAFGVPAALMVVALIVFIIGSGMYNKTAPQGNILVKVCKCIAFAIRNRYRHRYSQFSQRTHWMDWADEKYDKLLIAQVKMVVKVLFLYIPLPMFWALFDQQGSRWTLQATTMDGDFGLLTIQPDQMQTVNPILILVLVPIMDSVIYPLISKCKLNFTPLKKMTVGMFLAALAFIAAALVQLQIDVSVTNIKKLTMGQLVKPNSPTHILIYFPENPAAVPIRHWSPGKDHQHAGQTGGRLSWRLKFSLQPFTVLTYLIVCVLFHRFFNGYSSILNITTGTLDFGSTVKNKMSTYANVPHGEAKFHIKDNAGNQCDYSLTLGFGSSYTLLIPSTFKFGTNCEKSINTALDIKPNSFHMAWQIPQYFLITAGEVVFSVTGLEFSYSQAPSNMKSVLQAGWLLTVAVGNIIVLIVAEAAKLPDQWAEYILFASLLLLVDFLFAFMAYFYTYIDPAKIEAQFAHSDPKDKEKKKSLEMGRKDSDGNSNSDRKSSYTSHNEKKDVQLT
uniref:Solute carrier family 15 member 1b n=1 Tax=Labrus bergylta TaxID=56723 RepID=A0A3Q3EU96_9LABR